MEPLEQEAGKKPAPEYIGLCWMEKDGTIKMRLSAQGPDGIVGHSLLEYPPDHANYQEILKRVGPLKPGQFCSVPAWSD